VESLENYKKSVDITEKQTVLLHEQLGLTAK